MAKNKPISISPSNKHVLIRLNGTVIADSRNALALQEADYPVVYYIPRDEIEMDRLQPSDTSTICPYKGDASYFTAEGQSDIAWCYENPHDAVSDIKGHLAFYPDRTEIEITDP